MVKAKFTYRLFTISRSARKTNPAGNGLSNDPRRVRTKGKHINGKRQVEWPVLAIIVLSGYSSKPDPAVRNTLSVLPPRQRTKSAAMLPELLHNRLFWLSDHRFT